MTDNRESHREGLVSSGERKISTGKLDLIRRGLQLVDKLEEGTRTISFPKGQAIGKLLTTYTSNPPANSLDFFVEVCEAQGDISVPADIYLVLKIGEQYPNKSERNSSVLFVRYHRSKDGC